jgi:hypothetical protein
MADKNKDQLTRKLIRGVSALCGSAIIVAVSFMVFERSSIIYNAPAAGDFKTTIKNILDNLHFADLLFINAVIHLLTLWLADKKNIKPAQIACLAVANLIVITWLTLPFTGLGMAGKKEMNDKMTVLPRGIHAQELQPLVKTRFLDPSLENELVMIGSYSKKIGYYKEEKYPVQLNTTKNFFEDTVLHSFINQQSFIFLSKDTTIGSETNSDPSVIHITRFGNGRLKLIVDNSGYHFITFLQNDYPYWETFVNKKKVNHFTGYKTFITIPLEKGKQEIEFSFNPAPVRKALWINIAIIAIGLVLLATPRYRNMRLIS